MVRTRLSVHKGWGALRIMVAAVLVATFFTLAVYEPANAETYFSVQAEDMSLNPSSAGKVASDSSAWYGEYLWMWSNAEATKSITTTESVGEVLLRARGTQCEGAPNATVLIDGRQVMSRSVSSGTWAYYSASTSLSPGTHTVKVRFTNDHYLSSSCNRDLLVDEVALKSGTTDSGTTQPLLFSDTFDRSADTFEPPWAWVDRAYTDRLTTSSEVVRKGTHSAKMTVADGDVYPRTCCSSPRAQLNSPEIFREGDERYIGFSIYYPSNFPTLPSGGWLTTSEFFGKPWTEGGPIRTEVRPGNRESVGRDENYNYDTIWSAPLERGKWIDYVFRIKFSKNSSVGFVEFWRKGVKQTFRNGSTRIYTRTMDPDQTAPSVLQLKNYRKKGMFSSVTLYYDEVKVGNSYDAVSITPDTLWVT
jgi:hypothetical protein